MASRGVSVLKFVGTVSLGLLTGLSYTLSTLTVPSLLELPSASSAAHAFSYLASTAKKHLAALTGLSASSFLLAFMLSPRPVRHPYLLYTSILAAGSSLAVSDFLAPYLFISKSSSHSRPKLSTAAATAAATKTQQAQAASAKRAQMEASYEVLGSSATSLSAHSDDTPLSATSGEDMGDDDLSATVQDVNGEEVRTEVEAFLKRQLVQTAVSGLGFLVAVVGIWGDGVAAQVFRNDAVVIQP